MPFTALCPHHHLTGYGSKSFKEQLLSFCLLSFLRNFCHRFKPSRSCWIKYQPFKRELAERRKETGRRKQEAAKATTPSLIASNSIEEEVLKWFWGNQDSCLHLEISLGRSCGLYFLGNIVELHYSVCSFDFELFSKTVLSTLQQQCEMFGEVSFFFYFLLFCVCVCSCRNFLFLLTKQVTTSCYGGQ